jgi:hypothetical protein
MGVHGDISSKEKKRSVAEHVVFPIKQDVVYLNENWVTKTN